MTKTLLIVPTKNEKDPPLFTSKLLIKFQNILRNTTQVIIWHRVNILFSLISSPIVKIYSGHVFVCYGYLFCLFLRFLFPSQWSCKGVYWFHHVRPSVCRQILWHVVIKPVLFTVLTIKLTLITVLNIKPPLFTVWTHQTYVVYSIDTSNFGCLQHRPTKPMFFTVRTNQTWCCKQFKFDGSIL
jgi:hypothetical protein